MLLADLLPTVRSLPRSEQIQLMHYLVEELGRPTQATKPIESGSTARVATVYEVFSPEPCPEAADELLKLLQSQPPVE